MDASQIKISFVIPTLEERKVIEKLLQNLTTITDFNYEIIISDGGSKDQTIEIAKKYTDKVFVYNGKKRQTIAMARNMGAAQAKGEYLVFLDADVYIPNPQSFFKRALANFDNNSRLGGLSGWIRVFPELETWGDFFGYVIVSDCMFLLLNNVFHYGSTCGEFQMVKRDVFQSIGGYREHLTVAEDKDLFYRLSKIYRTRTDRSLLLYHTGRRPHTIGWPKLLWEWGYNSIHLTVFDRAHAEEWKVIR